MNLIVVGLTVVLMIIIVAIGLVNQSRRKNAGKTTHQNLWPPQYFYGDRRREPPPTAEMAAITGDYPTPRDGVILPTSPIDEPKTNPVSHKELRERYERERSSLDPDAPATNPNIIIQRPTDQNG